MKKLLLLFTAMGLLLSGCGQNSGRQELSLEQFAGSGGNYGFANLSYGQSQSEVEKQLSITFDNPQQTAQDVVLCTLPDYYQYDGEPVRLSLEFYQDGLRSLMFTIKPDDGADEIYADISGGLTELYGQPTETIENNSSGQNGMASKGMRWDSHADETTSLQVILMSGDRIEPVVSIGVGRIE